MNQDKTVTISEADYLRLIELENKKKVALAKWHAAGKRFNEQNPEKVKEIHRESNRRYYEKMKLDPNKLEERRLSNAISYARRRLETVGYISARTQQAVVTALELVWDTDKHRWILPKT